MKELAVPLTFAGAGKTGGISLAFAWFALFGCQLPDCNDALERAESWVKQVSIAFGRRRVSEGGN